MPSWPTVFQSQRVGALVSKGPIAAVLIAGCDKPRVTRDGLGIILGILKKRREWKA